MNRRQFVVCGFGLATTCSAAERTLAAIGWHKRDRFSFQVPEHPAGATANPFSLEKYDYKRYGPLLGVSNEGGAAKVIVEAAYRSAKALASPSPNSLVVGMMLDGERMTSAGESPIGPDEYSLILNAGADKTFCTTNVGTRVAARLHQPLPELAVKESNGREEAWLNSVFAQFDKFVHTPDARPRPLTVRLVVPSEDFAAGAAALRQLAPKLEAGRREGKIGPAEMQRFSILLLYPNEIKDQLQPIRDSIRLAAELGIPEVAIDGEPVQSSRQHLSVQGLLNVLEPAAADTLLREAAGKDVRLVYRYEDDPESAARTIWAELNNARTCGLNAAKYGLTPLMLDQQRYVIQQVQHWITDWTAIPALYVDIPLVTSDAVYESDRCVDAAKLWLKMAAGAGAKIVLIDAPDRIKPRRLLKATNNSDDSGVLDLQQAKQLNDYAATLGLRILWAGGIHADQAFELAKLGAFGLFTTTSTAKRVAVEGVLAGDPMMAANNEPTLPGVRKIHALVQAGFLCRTLTDETELCRAIESQARELAPIAVDAQGLEKQLTALNESLKRGWQRHWN